MQILEGVFVKKKINGQKKYQAITQAYQKMERTKGNKECDKEQAEGNKLKEQAKSG